MKLKMLLSLGMLMLSATQIYTIVTVQLFAFLNLFPVEADIVGYTFDNRSQYYEDLPSRFGFRLPSDGLKGFLINARPENACEPIFHPPLKDNSSNAFIALIRRHDCNFDVKVLNAQRAGYKAAVVYNTDSDDLLSMVSSDFNIAKQIDIPSVFIGETSAKSLQEEFLYEKGGHLILLPSYSLPLEYYLIPFLIIIGLCLVLIVIFMITKFVQDRHRARRNRLCRAQLKKIPVHNFKKGDEYDVCAICLEEYEEGDKLRILPCSHAYHTRCVDPWLTKTKKTCPVCKQKVVPSQGESDSDSDESIREENEASERTPLLRSFDSTTVQTFGTTSESLSHQIVAESLGCEDEEEPESRVMDEAAVTVRLQSTSEDSDPRLSQNV